MENTTRIVEIDGIKLEIDLRTAKKIEHFRVGDNVRVLVKGYSDTYKVHAGVIVGFDGFEKLPTICIAYLEVGYNSAEIKFAYINAGSESKDSKIEITPAFDLQELHCLPQRATANQEPSPRPCQEKKLQTHLPVPRM